MLPLGSRGYSEEIGVAKDIYWEAGAVTRHLIGRVCEGRRSSRSCCRNPSPLMLNRCQYVRLTITKLIRLRKERRSMIITFLACSKARGGGNITPASRVAATLASGSRNAASIFASPKRSYSGPKVGLQMVVVVILASSRGGLGREASSAPRVGATLARRG